MSWNQYNPPPGNFWDDSWNRVTIPHYVNRGGGRGNRGNNCYRPTNDNNYPTQQIENWFYEDNFECNPFDQNVPMSPPTARQNSYDRNRNYNVPRDSQADRPYRGGYNPRGNHNSNSRGIVNRSLSRRAPPNNGNSTRDRNFHSPAVSVSGPHHVSRIDSNDRETSKWNPPNPSTASRDRDSPPPKRRRGSDSGSNSSSGLQRSNSKDHASPRRDNNVSPRKAPPTLTTPSTSPKIIPLDRRVDTASSAGKAHGKDTAVPSSSRPVSSGHTGNNSRSSPSDDLNDSQRSPQKVRSSGESSDSQRSKETNPGPSPNSSKKNSDVNKETNDELGDLPDFASTSKRIRRDSGDSDKTEVITRGKKCKLPEKELEALKGYDQAIKEDWLINLQKRIALTIPIKKPVTIKQEAVAAPELDSSSSAATTSSSNRVQGAVTPQITCHEAAINPHQSAAETRKSEKSSKKENSSRTLQDANKAALISERRRSSHDSSASSSASGRGSSKNSDKSKHNSNDKRVAKAPDKSETATKDATSKNAVCPVRNDHTVSLVKEFSAKVTSIGVDQNRGSYLSGVSSTACSQKSYSKNPEVAKDGSDSTQRFNATSKGGSSSSADKVVQLPDKQKEISERKRAEEKAGEKSVSLSRNSASTSSFDVTKGESHTLKSSSLDLTKQLAKKNSNERIETNKYLMKAPSVPSSSPTTRGLPGQDNSKDTHLLSSSAASTSASKEKSSDSSAIDTRSQNPSAAVQLSKNVPAVQRDLLNVGGIERTKEASTNPSTPTEERNIAPVSMNSSTATVNVQENLHQVKKRVEGLHAQKSSINPGASKLNDCTAQVAPLETISTNAMPNMEKGRNSNQPVVPLNSNAISVTSISLLGNVQPGSQNVSQNAANSPLTNKTRECVSVLTSSAAVVLALQSLRKTMDTNGIETALGGTVVDKIIKESQKPTQPAASSMPMSASLQKEPLNQAVDLGQQVNATRDALASTPSVSQGQSSKPSKAISDSSPQHLTPISAVKSGNVISSATVNRIRLEHKISPSAKEVVSLEPEKSLRSLLTTGTSTLELSPVVSGNTESVQSPRKINKFKESAQKLQQLVRSERLSKESVGSLDQNDNKSSNGEEIVILPNAMAALLGAGKKVSEATLVENEVSAKLTEASGPKSIEKGAMPQKTRRQSIELITDDVVVVCLDNEPGDHSTSSKDDHSKNLASSKASEEKEDAQELISKPQNVVFPSHLITEKLPIVESTPSSKDVPNSSTDTPVTQKLSASSSIAGIGSSVQEKTNELEAPLVENSILANLAGSNTTPTDVPLPNGNILENDSHKDTTTSATRTQASVPLSESSIVSAAPGDITSDPHNISAGVRKEISDVVPEFAQFVEDDEDDDEIQVIEVFDKRNSFPRRRSQDRINELREKLAQRDKDTVPHATDMVLPKQSTTPPPNTAMSDNFPIPETNAPITVAQKSPSKIYKSMPELVEDIIVSALEASGTSLEEEMETGESHPTTTSSDPAAPSMASLNSNEYSLNDLRISLTPPSTLNQSALSAPVSAASVISPLVSAPVASTSEDNFSIVISSTVSLAESATEMNEGLHLNEVSNFTGSSSQKSAQDQSQPEFYPVMSILDAPKADTGIQCEIWKEDKVCSGCQSVKCMAEKNCSEDTKCTSDELCFPPKPQHYKKSVAGHVESMRRCVEECNSHLADWKEDGSPEVIYGKLKKMNDILRVRSHAIECRMASMEAAKIVPKELYRAQPVDHTKLLSVDGMSEYFRMLLQIEELPQIPETQSSSNNAFILQVLRFRILRVLNYYCRQTPGAQDPSILNLLSCILSNPEYKRKIGAWSVEKIVAAWDAVKKYEGEFDKAAIEKEYVIGTKSLQKLVIMLTNCVLKQQGMAQRVANANATVSNAQASTANSAAATTSGQYLQRLVVSPVTPSPPPNPAGTNNAGLQHVLTSRNNVQRGSHFAMNGIPQQVSENPTSSALRTVMTPVPQEASYGNQINQNSMEQNPTVGHRVPNTRISSPVPSSVYVQATRTGNTNTQQPSERAGSPGGWTPIGRHGALYRFVPDQPTQDPANLATATGVSQMFTASAPTSTSQFQSQTFTNVRQTTESVSIQTPPLASPSYVTAQLTANFQGPVPNASVQRVSVPQGSSGQRSYKTPQQHQLQQTLPSAPYPDLPQGTQLIRVPRTTTPQPGVTGVHQVNNTQGHGGVLYSQLSLQQQQLLLRYQQQQASNQQREQYHQRNQQAVQQQQLFNQQAEQQQLFNQQAGQQQQPLNQQTVQYPPSNQQTVQYPPSNQQTVQQQQRQSNQRAPQFHGQQYQQEQSMNQKQAETHHDVSIIHHYPANQAANNIVGNFIATPSSASNAANQSNQRNNCPQVSQPSFGDVYLP